MQSICISPNAAQAHINHGCYVGPCNEANCGSSKTEDSQTAITWSVDLFPNPAYNNVNVQIVHAESVIRIELVNAYGQLIYSESLLPGEFETALDLNVSSYAEGVYYLVVSTDGTVQTKTLVIRR